MVKVVRNEKLNVLITPTKKAGFGSIRLDSVKDALVGNLMVSQKRTVFISGEIDVLARNFKEGQFMPGVIIKKESFIPFYATQKPKINPSTMDTVLTDGKLTYLQFEYTEAPGATDVWVGTNATIVASVNTDAIAAQAI